MKTDDDLILDDLFMGMCQAMMGDPPEPDTEAFDEVVNITRWLRYAFFGGIKTAFEVLQDGIMTQDEIATELRMFRDSLEEDDPECVQ